MESQAIPSQSPLIPPNQENESLLAENLPAAWPDVCFVCLRASPEFQGRFALHSFSNPMAHEPRGPIVDTKLALQLVGTHAFSCSHALLLSACIIAHMF